MRIFPLLVFLLAFLPSQTEAQQSLYFEDPYNLFREAEELYRLGQYAAAADMFDRVERIIPAAGSDELYTYRISASYYRAVCALELYNPDAEELLLDFAFDYDDHPKKQLAYFQLGRYYFREKKYRTAIEWFDKVSLSDLDPIDRNNYNFMLGYCYFNRKMLREAKPLFADVRQERSQHYYAANYYYGYIALEDKEYEDALQAFETAGTSKSYERVVPYYIGQVYFAKGDYADVIQYCTPKLDDTRLKYYTELHQLVGQAHYVLGRHDEALPFLRYFVNKARKVRPQDYFQLAVAQYSAGRYKESIPNFDRLEGANDTLAQEALYLAADAHLKLGEKEQARAAFQEAARKDGDPERASASIFNAAKLSHELGFHGVAIEEFRDFIMKFPESRNQTEAQELLADAFLRTRDFQSALETIESVPGKSKELEKALQKVAFFRGVELYQDGRFGEAKTRFEQSRQYPQDLNLDASALFWLGELAFRDKQYNQALDQHAEFLRMSNGRAEMPGGATVIASRYTSGYANMELKRYSKARPHFAEVASKWNPKSEDRFESQVATDARLRLADCYYLSRDYARAEREYKRAVDNELTGSDYALYQRGIIKGLQGDLKGKAGVLRGIYQDYPESQYADDALYEIGNSQLVLGLDENARSTFETLLKEQPDGAYTSRTLLKLGLIHYNFEQYDESLAYYTQAAEDYKGSAESRDALNGIKDISVAKGQPEIYTSLESIAASEKDSVTYDAAFSRYAMEDCDGAIMGFGRYLSEFPNGFFAEPAHFYRAECQYAAKNYTDALPDYEVVLQGKQGRFTETSLLKAARIAYFQDENYVKAVALYRDLYTLAEQEDHTYEALKGLVRANYYLKDYDQVLEFADDLQKAVEATSEEIVEATFYEAKAHEALGFSEKAYQRYGDVAAMSSNAFGVESRYQQAKIEFNRGNIKDAKATALRLVRETPAYAEWVVKSYILIADVFREQGDLVSARAALSSLLEGYDEDPALLEIIRQKLEQVVAIQAANSRLDSGNDDEFMAPIDGNDPRPED